MSQLNLNSDTHTIRANTVSINSDKTPLVVGKITLPSLTSGSVGGGLAISKSADTYADGIMVDSTGAVPSGTVALYCTRINNQIFWTLQQVDGNSGFICGATATPLWLGKWPSNMRPTFADGMFLPVTVQRDTGVRETMFLVVGPNGDMTLNVGTSVLFTATNVLYIGGSGVFVIENY